jgi:hypothetical protein
MALLDTIKKADRITTTALDTEITRLIAWARAEMVRVGVPADKAASTTDDLIQQCIVEGVLSKIATDEKIRDAAADAFMYQLDVLRKYTWPEEPEPEPEPDPEPDPEPEPEPEPEEEGDNDS